MSREWKPGDVGQWDGSIDGRLFFTKEGWIDDEGIRRRPSGPLLRPLVVIDPEDVGDRARLTEAIKAVLSRQAFQDMGEAVEAALRAFANPTPPKPDEPTGLGAVVEEADGTRWTRVESAAQPSRNPWYPADDPDLQPDEWAGIQAVRVLSEGVQS